jgi:hypothetical protein
MESRVVEIAQGALAELDALGVPADGSTESDLLSDLQPAPEPSDVATE